MAKFRVESCCRHKRTPATFANSVRHLEFFDSAYSLNIHRRISTHQNSWTPLLVGGLHPLGLAFLLNVEEQPIHPAPSPRVALDQDTLKEITLPLYHSPRGDAGRIIPAILVERSGEHFDGAYKAHCIDSRESTQFISAGADTSLLGLFCFYWGKKRQQIFYALSRIKNRNSLSLSGVRFRLHFAWATCPSNFALRLNALRVAERNLIGRGATR